MTDAALASLEIEHIVIASQFPDTYYCIRKDGGGMHILSGTQELTIHKDYMEPFWHEMIEVWMQYKPKN
jgi:hypothetical protein